MDRRYTEAEVAQILDEATRGDAAPVPTRAGAGLTLPEVRAVAAEVGIDADAVNTAAAGLASAAKSSTPWAGLKRRSRMTRVVPLSDVPSDEEWDRMVVALREVFGAAGEVERSGTLRSWTARGIEVHGEPDPDGYRIRIHAKDDNGWSSVVGGAVSLTIGGLMLAGVTLAGATDLGSYVASGALFLVGGGWMAFGHHYMKRWARRATPRLQAAVARVRGLPPSSS